MPTPRTSRASRGIAPAPGPPALSASLRARADATTANDWQISPEQPLCYRVLGYNSYGDSDESMVDCAAVPAATSTLVAGRTGTAVVLSWIKTATVIGGVEVPQAGEGDV